jgi:hypothetical protein
MNLALSLSRHSKAFRRAHATRHLFLFEAGALDDYASIRGHFGTHPQNSIEILHLIESYYSHHWMKHFITKSVQKEY